MSDYIRKIRILYNYKILNWLSIESIVFEEHMEIIFNISTLFNDSKEKSYSYKMRRNSYIFSMILIPFNVFFDFPFSSGPFGLINILNR